MEISAFEFAVCVVSATVLPYWIVGWDRARRKRKRWMESFTSQDAIDQLNQSREAHGIQTDRGGHRVTDPSAPRPQVSPQGRPRQ